MALGSVMVPGLPRRYYDLPGGTSRTETTGVGEPGTVPTPLAEPGRPIPYLIGRQRVVRPNAIWMGNLRPVYEETQEVESVSESVPSYGVLDGAIVTTTETVTRTYSVIGYNLSMQFSICLGPGVVLRSIGMGEETLWSGTVGPGRTEFNIPDNETYMSGKVIFSGGNFDQAPDPFLAQYIDPLQLPGYIGVAHIIIEDLRVDQLGGSYPWFEVERFPNPLGLSGANNRKGDDINIGTAIADYVGSEWGGAGAGPNSINQTSFNAAALVLSAEGNAVSFQLDQESTAATIIKILQGQADSLIFEDPNTGEVHLKLLRRSMIDPLTAVQLSPDRTNRIGRWNRDAWPVTKNKLRVTYNNRAKGYARDSVLGYNFNAINDRFKANRSMTIDFPLCNTPGLAKSLLSRELGKLGVPISAGEVEVNRIAGDLLPGDGVQVIMPDRITPVTAMATKIRRFSLSENRIVVGFVELSSQITNVVFDAETGLGGDFNIAPTIPSSVVIKQTPYWLARRSGNINSQVQTASIFALVLPTPDSYLQASFNAHIENQPGASGLTRVNAYAPYPTVGKLGVALGQFEAMDTGVIPSLNIAEVVNPIFLRSEGAIGVTEGRIFLLIDDEILSFETASENLDGSWTLTNVYRALLDTSPQAHAMNAPAFVIGNNYGTISSAFRYPAAFSPIWRISSNTAFAEGRPLVSYLPFTGWDMSFNRPALPPRPHDTKIDAAARSASLTNVFGEPGLIVSPGQNIAVTWKTRSRITLAVSKQADPAEDAELNPNGTYQKHRVLIRDSGNTLRDCGVTNDDATYNSLAATVHASTALGRGNLFVRAESTRGNSKYEDQIPVFVMSTDYFISEDDADFFISEDGASLFVMET